MLQSRYSSYLYEAGCDEAGRGCLAGPVTAAAVILPSDYQNNAINDSKKLSPSQRNKLRTIIENEALAWAVAFVDNKQIDKINILTASILAMHHAVNNLKITPGFLLIDGNRFTPYKNIPFTCVVKGDSKYINIAAASILAKTHRDEYMLSLHEKYPGYGWNTNFGYPTAVHKQAINKQGLSEYHRLTFNTTIQLKLSF